MYLLYGEVKTLWPLLSQGYRTITKRKFTFYHSVPRSSSYSTNQPQKGERLSWTCSQPVVLNRGPLDWESSTLTTRSLLHESRTFKKLRAVKKLNIYLIKWNFDSFLLWELQKMHVNVFLTDSYQVVKSKSF